MAINPKKIPVATCELTGTILETLLFGIYVTVWPQCMRILRRKKMNGRITYIFAGTMIITLILVIIHIFVDLVRLYQAFTSNIDVAGAPEAFYANVNTNLVMTKNATYVSATLLADALLLYRTWIVWSRNWWILSLPIPLFALDFAMSVWATWSITLAKPGTSVLVSTVFERLKYFYSATFALNLTCTALIGFKIWSIQRGVSGLGRVSQGRRAGALTIVLESAAIYSAVSVALIVTSILGSSAMFFFLNSTPPLIGSVFSYVIIRSSSDIQRYNTTLSSLAANNSGGRGDRVRRTNFGTVTIGSKVDEPRSPVNGVRVELQQIVHSDFIEMDEGHDKSSPSTKSRSEIDGYAV